MPNSNADRRFFPRQEPSMRTQVRISTIAGLLTVALVLAAAGGAEARGEATQETGSDRLWHHEEEFSRDPSLRATPNKVVILHLQPATEAGKHVDHRIPYRFDDTGIFTFCIPAQDPHIREMSLIAERGGNTVVRVDATSGCVTQTVAPGRYDLLVKHDGADIEARGKKAFIHIPRLHTPRRGQADGRNAAADGLPLACDPNGLNPQSVVQTLDDGLLLTAGPGQGPVDPSNPSAVNSPPFSPPLRLALSAPGGLGDLTGQYPAQFGNPRNSLWPLLQALWIVCADGNGNYTFRSSFGGDLTANTTESNIYLAPATTLPDKSYLFLTPRLSDLGNSEFTMSFYFNGIPGIIAAYIDPLGRFSGNLFLTSVGSPNIFTLTVPFNYYPPGMAIRPPQLGQVATSDPNNPNWPSWVFNTSIPRLDDYFFGTVSLGMWLGHSYTTPGPQTLAVFYDQPNYAGNSVVVTEATTAPPSFVPASLKIASPRQFVASTHVCNQCNLSGVDLSNLDVSNGSFEHSTFSGADLTNTNFTGAALDQADFSGAATVLSGTTFASAKLHCAKFSGADVSSATFVTPQVTTDFSCLVDLTAATLDVRTFAPQLWRYLNLRGATINNVAGAVLSTVQAPVDLSGAILSGLDLHGVRLDGANLGCASATRCTQLVDTRLETATLQGANLVNANLQGAVLDRANLTGANLCAASLNESPTLQRSASLVGAQLKNVNLTNADLTGANLSSANFYSSGTPGSCATGCAASSCASAVGAHMIGTNFTGAYLSGTDMSDSNAQSATFAGALLVGVNLSGVNLSTNAALGTAVSFQGAFLQGANFTGTNVASASFLDAYVTPVGSQGGNVIVQLDASQHVAFPGYQPGGTPGCVLFGWTNAFTFPATDDSNTCPNGLKGPCDLVWQSPSTPITSAQPPSTFDFSLPTGCQQFDANW